MCFAFTCIDHTFQKRGKQVFSRIESGKNKNYINLYKSTALINKNIIIIIVRCSRIIDRSVRTAIYVAEKRENFNRTLREHVSACELLARSRRYFRECKCDFLSQVSHSIAFF